MNGPEPLRVILLVDDDPNDIFLMRRLLTKAGVKNPVVSFGDGEELLGFLRPATQEGAGTPGLRTAIVFLDLKMPKLDGFEALRWIRMQKVLKDLPVVILSGSEEPRDIKKAKELGATAYLTKHPEVETLVRVFSTHAAQS